MVTKPQVVTTIEIEQTFENILQILLPYRRTNDRHDDEHTTSDHCFTHQFDQMLPFVTDRAPVLFTLPAFPCKSPSAQKVLGHLPDMGERASLRFLQGLCEKIGEVYSPGARMLICSDGHVFGDLIRVPDWHITEYGNALRKMAEEEDASAIEFFGLEDVYGKMSFDEKRKLLSTEFAEPIELLKQNVKQDEEALALYRGITKFLVEDGGSVFTGTKSALLRECRQRAYGVIQRSRAWSNLIADYHPHSFRLSIHPQPCESAKFGISLLDSRDAWVTPWHSVAVQRPDRSLALMKRSEAERIGHLVHVNGVPDHYTIEEM
jgi:L-tyrosine isonitrile synthase